MSEVSHTGTILAAFGLTAAILLLMIGAIWWDYRRLCAQLARLGDRRDA